nr:biotin--[acetyl-CoA-carboxylase] ligase [Lachnospiraceae bacterium]
MDDRVSAEKPEGLNTRWAGQEYRYLEVTESTNDDCIRFLQEGASHGITVVAGAQTGGKGRRGRRWDSPPGDAVYMTIGLKPDFSPEKASMLTLVTALAVCKAAEETVRLAGVKSEETMFRIKWPNDIVLGGRKVCGILTEMRAGAGRIEQIVIGIGINVNCRSFPEEIKETATSLWQVTGVEIAREEFICRVLEQFEYYYEKFAEKCDMSTIMGEYVEKLVNVGKEVRVLNPQGEYTAVALGINEQGELLVKKEDGTITPVYAGEVSVRGIYGYV